MTNKSLISVTTPVCEIHRYAFSSTVRNYTVQDVQHIDPRFRHCQHLTTGGLYTRDLQQIVLADRQGGHHWDLVSSIDPPVLLPCEIPASIRLLKGRTLYLGHYMNHYGHFISETMSRLWAIDNDVHYDHFAFFPFIFDDGEIVVHKFQNLMLRRFGLQGKSLIRLGEPMAFEELHVPQALSHINSAANINLKKTYDVIAKPLRTGPPSRRIFLSRLQPYARIANVTQVEDLFRRLNFEIAYPETMDIADQLVAYANTTILAGFAGSALHNCVFCPPGARLLELGDLRSPNEPLIMQTILNQLSRVDARYVPYAGTPDGVFDLEYLAGHVANILASDPQPQSTGLIWPGSLHAHLAGFGDTQTTGELKAGQFAATGNQIEGITITLEPSAPFGCEYQILNHNGIWSQWLPAGQFAGSKGMQSALRGIAIRLTGPQAYRFECTYEAGFIGQPNLITTQDGAPCTSPDQAPLISLEIKLHHR